MCSGEWTDLCEAHITGPYGVLTGYNLLTVIYLLISEVVMHAHTCFIFSYLLTRV